MDVPQPDPVLGAIHEEATMARKQAARAARLAETATPSLEDEQEMLCLALLAYRGFADVNLPMPHEERLWLDIARGLGEAEVGGGVRAAATSLRGYLEAFGPELIAARHELAGLLGTFARVQGARRDASSSERVRRALELWTSRSRRELVRRAGDALHWLTDRSFVRITPVPRVSVLLSLRFRARSSAARGSLRAERRSDQRCRRSRNRVCGVATSGTKRAPTPGP
jgi:hypothetical protein